MTKMRKTTLTDGARVMEIWRRAVNATHGFLSTEDRKDIEVEVAAFFPSAPLDLAVDETDRAIGFMLLHGIHNSDGHAGYFVFAHGCAHRPIDELFELRRIDRTEC
jgi:hypothetical protein